MSPKSNRSNHALDLARESAMQEPEARQKSLRRERRRERFRPKITWIVLLILLLAIAASATFINWIKLSLVSSNYSKQMQLQQIYLGLEDSFIIASQGDLNVKLQGRNIDRAMTTVSISDHRILSKAPEYNAEDAVYLTLSNGVKFIIAPDPNYQGSKDKAFIIYEDHGKFTYLSVEGYKTMYWLEQVTGPEGAYGPNQVVKVGELVP